MEKGIFDLRLGLHGCEGLTALLYTILYKGLEHLQILVSWAGGQAGVGWREGEVGPGANPHGYQI